MSNETTLPAETRSKTTVVRDASRRTGPALAVLALLCNALTIPIGLSLWQTVVHEGDRAAAVGFVFPAMGFLLLAWALRKNLQLMVHGASELVIYGNGVVAGNVFEGRVTNHRKQHFEGPVRAVLNCIRHSITGSGDSASSRRTVIWTATQLFPSETAGVALGLDVRFHIPDYLPPSGKSKSDSSVSWELVIEAAATPVAFNSRFVIPVLGRTVT